MRIVLALVLGATLAATPSPWAATQETVVIAEGTDDPGTWGFRPVDLAVDAGATVEWQNDGKNLHTVTSDDGAFDSGDILPGLTWRRTFDKPGVFAYHCHPHPWMKATVRVAGPGG